MKKILLTLSFSLSPMLLSNTQDDGLRKLNISNNTGVEDILNRENVARINSHLEHLSASVGNHTGSGGGGEALPDYAIPIKNDRCFEKVARLEEPNSLNTMEPSHARVFHCEQESIKYYKIQESEPDIGYSYTDRGYSLGIKRSKFTWNNRPTHLIEMTPYADNHIDIYLQEIENCSLDRQDRSSLLKSLARIGVEEYINSSFPEEIKEIRLFDEEYEKENIGVVFVNNIYNKVYALDTIVTSKRPNYKKCFRARAKTRVHGNGVIIRTINEILSSVTSNK
ncbi:hypothetical protein [Pseudobacteriovorax antillogorgiicola]|uniref:Uncharacterized protein n=1 Tax=Pseudobacteriovorax antillogorgiicola TaxID=1513793 RepID=A0A1Y6CRN0_9BACT|nr:hypothetical protein [Pseudobacteriovorax antillogorgiicola]TCS41790.1 hypothetical protein EDD56_1464 [Pseudobacteriovorax antillogorgiicola]SMF83507.1 hypothetical protein SAMN06296036_14717 [Pseudobacteriovorax antillogorgiicola]